MINFVQEPLRALAFLILFSAFLLLPDHAYSKEAKTVNLTSGEWPPYTSEQLDNNGLALHIIKEAFDSQGYEVFYSFYPWKRSLEIAKHGLSDGSAVWQTSDERKKHFYNSHTVVETSTVFFHRKDYDFDWSSPKDLIGRNVGTTRGYIYTPSFRTELANNNITVFDSDSDLINLKLLLNGRIDVHPLDITVGRYLISESPNLYSADASLTSHPRSLINAKQVVIFPKKLPRSGEFTDALNRGLETIRKDGRYQEILKNIKDDRIVRVALAHWPPWKIIDGANYDGIDVKILQELGSRLDLTFSYLSCPWRRCIELVKDGKADLITNFGKNKKRSEYVHYLGPSYYTGDVAFYCNADNQQQINSLTDLQNQRIGMVKGSTYFDEFDEDIHLDKVEITSEVEMLQMLEAKRLDLVIGFETALDYSITSSGFQETFVKSNFHSPSNNSNSYLAMSKKSKKLHYRHAIAQMIKEMVDKDEIKPIIQTFINSSSPELSP